ncbi:hypothetical protein ABG067_007141 [Albugo candida]|uniref:CS domain-containing protein n=1 Tax=Albugo candida TaxID=65357 RepID=A0A024GVT0_9STRA|nr:unnamed protein product [Albugo candida]|eukprot:CCI50813.1 unnamed protein product [Albugo candida]
MTSSSLCAPVKWAQRSDSLYVTIDLCDVKDEKVSLNDKSLFFEGTSNDQKYSVKLDFFKEVNAEAKESIWVKTDRNLQFHILKKNTGEEFWPRLLEDKHLEKTNVTVDWSLYMDEDDTKEEEKFDMNALGGGDGFDFNQMMSAQNANMMEDDESDSDDETMPELETKSD